MTGKQYPPCEDDMQQAGGCLDKDRSSFCCGLVPCEIRWGQLDGVEKAALNRVAGSPSAVQRFRCSAFLNNVFCSLFEKQAVVHPLSKAGARGLKIVIWLILPVVICLSQRLSHACLSISNLYCETANGSLNQLSFI